MLKTVSGGSRQLLPSAIVNRAASRTEVHKSPETVSDRVELSQVDSAVEALCLPILEPTFQLSLAAGYLLSLRAAGGHAPLIDIVLHSQAAGSHTNIHSVLDLTNAKDPIQVDGQVAGQAVSGQVTMDPAGRGISWAGARGVQAERGQLGFDPAAQALTLQAEFGAVKADLSFKLLGGSGLKSFQGFEVSGTVDGQPYHSLNRFAMQPDGQATLSCDGQLADSPISKQYRGQLEQTGSSISLNLQGSGNSAGVEQQVETVFTYLP
ncbi:MAG: hypothetical protein AB7S38_20580 [Vulcanimicrobiota bacterium]